MFLHIAWRSLLGQKWSLDYSLATGLPGEAWLVSTCGALHLSALGADASSAECAARQP